MRTVRAHAGVKVVECLATARTILGGVLVLGVCTCRVVACDVLGGQLVCPLIAVDTPLHHAHHGVPLRLRAKTCRAYLLAVLHNRLGVGTDSVVAHAIIRGEQNIALRLPGGGLWHTLP